MGPASPAPAHPASAGRSPSSLRALAAAILAAASALLASATSASALAATAAASFLTVGVAVLRVDVGAVGGAVVARAGRRVRGTAKRMVEDVRTERTLRRENRGRPLCEDNFEEDRCGAQQHCVWTADQTCVWQDTFDDTIQALPPSDVAAALAAVPAMTVDMPCPETDDPGRCNLCPGKPAFRQVVGRPPHLCDCARQGPQSYVRRSPAALRERLAQLPRRQWPAELRRWAGPQCPSRRLLPWQRFLSESIFFARTSCLAWWATGAGKTALALAAMRRFLPRMLPGGAAFDPSFKIVFLYPDETRLGDNFTKEVRQGYLSQCDEDDILSLVHVGGGVDRSARPAVDVPGRRRKIFLFPLSIFGHLLPQPGGGTPAHLRTMDSVSAANDSWQSHLRTCMDGVDGWNTPSGRHQLLRNTLLLVDEAHNLQYSSEDASSRRKHGQAYAAIAEAVQRCHREQYDEWATLPDAPYPPRPLTAVLMTATPVLYSDHPERFRTLANMLEPVDEKGQLAPLRSPLSLAEAGARLRGRIFHVDPKGTAFYPLAQGLATVQVQREEDPATLAEHLQGSWATPADLAWKIPHTFATKAVRPGSLPALQAAFPKGERLVKTVSSLAGVHLIYVDLDTSRIATRTPAVRASGIATPVPDALVAMLNQRWGRESELHLDHLFRLLLPPEAAAAPPARWPAALEALQLPSQPDDPTSASRLEKLAEKLAGGLPRWVPGRDHERVLNLYTPYRLPGKYVDDQKGANTEGVRTGFALLVKTTLELFNAINQRQQGSGKFVKAILITRTMLEGVSFLNTRHLHMLRRPPTAKDLRQLMGRISRMFGMCAIPSAEQRQVRYYLYCVDCPGSLEELEAGEGGDGEEALTEERLLRTLAELSGGRQLFRQLRPTHSESPLWRSLLNTLFAGGYPPLRIRRWAK